MSKAMTLNRNSRKSATKLLLINWARFKRETITLEGSTLFTGVNGSGKSTLLDAMTYMLTGNTKFNQAAQDKDRDVISYVRGDTKSEGKNRYLREGEVSSYVAMEFYSPLEEQFLVVGVCIEYVNEGSNSKKWFVFKDTQLKDIRFYEEKGNEITVFPRSNLLLRGKKVPAGDFMNRDKGTEQILRALGLRCGVDKYKAKLVKMMSFKPENNIDRFIQTCVLDEHSIHSMEGIREHRTHYNEAREFYETLSKGKKQLDVVQDKIKEYEVSEKKHEIRRILLFYQAVKELEEKQAESKKNVQNAKSKQEHLQVTLRELEKKRESALNRKIQADSNDILRGVSESIEGLKTRIASLKEDVARYKDELLKLQRLEKNLRDILDWFPEGSLFGKEKAILEYISSTDFSYDEKLSAFINFKEIMKEKQDLLQEERYHSRDKLKKIGVAKQELQDVISELKKGILPFESKYEKAKRIIQKELAEKNIRTDVRLFAELVQDIDSKWQLPIETFLGKKRFDLIVDGAYVQEVMEIVHKHHLQDVTVVITDKLPETEVQVSSAASMLKIPNVYGRRYANYLLNGLHLCENLTELHEYPKGGLMPDGTLSKSYAMSCMDVSSTKFYMGKDAIKKQLAQAEAEHDSLQVQEHSEREKIKVTNQRIQTIEAIEWKENRYVFDAEQRISDCNKEKGEKEAELKDIENTPGFAAAFTEQKNAQKEYNKLDREYVSTNSDIESYKKDIRKELQKQENRTTKITEAKQVFEDAILKRLELRKDVIALYEKARAKSSSATVIKQETVDKHRSEMGQAVHQLEEAQKRYWRIMGQSDEKYGVGYIRFFRAQYAEVANVRIEEAKQKLAEQALLLENAFMVDFVAELNEAIEGATDEIEALNQELKNIPFGKDTYQFTMVEKPERMIFFHLCKKLKDYMFSVEAYRNSNKDDQELEYYIQQFMNIILEEENEEEYTDYRKYFKYDMKIRSKQDRDETTADLSKKQGSASNGEKQTPYFIILAASLMQCYPRSVSCARLAFIDEAFSALSRERIEQMVKFFEDNMFQVIYAAPPEKIDSIGSHIHSTVSLCTKGKYTWAVEGLVRLDEFQDD